MRREKAFSICRMYSICVDSRWRFALGALALLLMLAACGSEPDAPEREGRGRRLWVWGVVAIAALALIALGVDSLSVAPTAIPELKQALAGARLEPIRGAMEGILALSDARSVAGALREAQLACGTS